MIDFSKIISASGPTCSGESTLAKLLVFRHSNVSRVRTATTRKIRPSDSPDQYIWMSDEKFLAEVGKENFLEHTFKQEQGTYYGIHLPSLEKQMQEKPDNLFMVSCNVDGVKALKNEGVDSIFIDPGSLENIRTRLANRDKNISMEEFNARMIQAKKELAEEKNYRLRLFNDKEIEKSYSDFVGILSRMGYYLQPRYTIACDGFGQTGKSTTCLAIASELDLIYLDSGALYRSLAFFGVREGWDFCKVLNSKPVISQDLCNGKIITIVNGEDVSPYLRTPKITELAPYFAKEESVRLYIRDTQRNIASTTKGFVAEGRDMTYNIFPDAEKKFFFDANILERAKRYAFSQSGFSNISYLKALEMLSQRDIMDLSRAVHPLKPSFPGVITFNTSALEVEEMKVEFLRRINPALVWA